MSIRQRILVVVLLFVVILFMNVLMIAMVASEFVQDAYRFVKGAINEFDM